VTDASVTAPNSAPKATLFLLAGLVALSEFAVTAYIPAITIIADGLAVRTEIVQTTVSVGLVTGAIAGLVIGAIADSMGRRQLLFPALGLYIVGSIFAAAAPSISWLFIGRLLQAVGACAGIILSRAIARDLHSGAQLTRLLSGVTLVFSLAPAVAPLLGGLLARMASDLRIRCHLRVRCIRRHASSTGNEKGAGCADKSQSNLRYL
jgi:MFS transporter, DHA1 family, multidrug resistance protein